MYKVGKVQNIQPLFLYRIVQRAFDTALFGYKLHKDADFKMEAVNFAKAADKFGNFLGKDFVNHGGPNFWKKICQNFENWCESEDCFYVVSSFQ